MINPTANIDENETEEDIRLDFVDETYKILKFAGDT